MNVYFLLTQSQKCVVWFFLTDFAKKVTVESGYLPSQDLVSWITWPPRVLRRGREKGNTQEVLLFMTCSTGCVHSSNLHLTG